MKPLLALVAAAFALAACSSIPLGKIQDRRLDPGQRGPNLAGTGR